MLATFANIINLIYELFANILTRWHLKVLAVCGPYYAAIDLTADEFSPNFEFFNFDLEF